MEDCNFFNLKGQVIKQIELPEIGVGDFTSIFTNKLKYTLSHSQDCCENVRLFKVVGNIEDILNEEITLAESDNKELENSYDSYDYSHTWTNFYLETKKGRLELHYLGESNGYYSESIDLWVEKL